MGSCYISSTLKHPSGAFSICANKNQCDFSLI
ncbi:hypothetical protein [Salmonella phage SD-1_S14]|nr:hypothetical protein [Salmonella phage SD-2_S15]WPK18914.1 hypothetical protein [Salmonella phage SD-6_S16]WPK19583.1 hypothetical protein [Salmonella phage SD-1_S14]WPK20608.1 hypothetical protein [Salmonella phage SD-15_S21]